jgi:hypothetical protein
MAMTARHNAVRDFLFRLGRELQLRVEREPQFPVRVEGAEGRRADLVIYDWEGGKDLHIDVVGSSPLSMSSREAFVPGKAMQKGVARKLVSYREILRAQPAGVEFLPFSFETMGGLHADALLLLGRLQGVVNLAVVRDEVGEWSSVVRRMSFIIAKAVARQLSTRLVGWGDAPLR